MANLYQYPKVLFVLVLLQLTVVSNIRAQFVGDYFFEQPSHVVSTGSAVELNLQFFAGPTALGASSFEILFDPAEFQIEDVSTGNFVSTVHTTGVFDRRTSTAKFAVYNDQSFANPFGTINLIKIFGIPLAPAGSTVQISVQPILTLDTSGGNFPQASTASTILNVVALRPIISNQVTMLSTRGDIEVSPQMPFDFRSPGSHIQLWLPKFGENSSRPRLQLVDVLNYDPTAPRDVVDGAEDPLLGRRNLKLKKVPLKTIQGQNR